jgi:hypothetical protein
MKKLSLVIALAAILFYSSAAAEGGSFGLGLIAGEPSGLSAKLWMSHNTALDAAVAWSLFNNNPNENQVLDVHGDLLFHNFHLINVDRGRLPLYYGIGGRIKFSSPDNRIGLRVPVGLEYIFERNYVDLFLEVVPLFDLTPANNRGLRWNSAIGIRYFF